MALNRVTVYKATGIATSSDLVLKNYHLVAAGTHAVGAVQFPYHLYFLKTRAKAPSWYSAFAGLPLDEDSSGKPRVRIAGYVLHVQHGTDHYVFTGGIGHIAFRAGNEYEHRFGALVAEKLLSQPEVRGLVQKDANGIVMRLDRVFRGRYNALGEVDNLRRILSSIRGTLHRNNPHYAEIGKSVKAGDSLTVSGTKTFDELFEFIAAVDALWQSNVHTLQIPQLQMIDKTTSAVAHNALEGALIAELLGHSGGSGDLFIDGEDVGYIPDVVDHYVVVNGATESAALHTSDEVLKQAADILQPLAGPQRAAVYGELKLRIIGEDESEEIRPLSHFVCGDIFLNNEAYFLNLTEWFKANEAFWAMVNRELDNIECLNPTSLQLVAWDPASHNGPGGENRFNAACCANGAGLLLDSRTVRLDGERGPIELCDILQINGDRVDFIHVKKENGAGLRELFAQGYVAADFYRDESFRNKVHSADLNGANLLSAGDRQLLASLATRHRRNFRVVFAIYDDTPANALQPGASSTSQILNGTLTPFAKIDLLERAQRIRSMGYGDVAVTRIR